MIAFNTCATITYKSDLPSVWRSENVVGFPCPSLSLPLDALYSSWISAKVFLPGRGLCETILARLMMFSKMCQIKIVLRNA